MRREHNNNVQSPQINMIIDCPFDQTNGLLNLATGDSVIAGSDTITWDSTMNAYKFKQNGIQGANNAKLQNVNISELGQKEIYIEYDLYPLWSSSKMQILGIGTSVNYGSVLPMNAPFIPSGTGVEIIIGRNNWVNIKQVVNTTDTDIAIMNAYKNDVYQRDYSLPTSIASTNATLFILCGVWSANSSQSFYLKNLKMYTL